MVLVYILAGIGGLFLFGIAGIILFIVLSFKADSEEEKDVEEKRYICALTNRNCIYLGDQGNCVFCPVGEEAEKIGDR